MPIKTNADQNREPRNRYPNRRRNNYKIKAPLKHKPSDIDRSVIIAIVNEIMSPDLEIGEQDQIGTKQKQRIEQTTRVRGDRRSLAARQQGRRSRGFVVVVCGGSATPSREEEEGLQRVRCGE
ncbi:hypothetical protein Droror1_Dr00012056 [Drosera rotundifolia]